MSVADNRIKILSESEVEEVYGVPQFSEEQRAYYFELNDEEKSLISRKNDPLSNLYRILFLGYFKYIPVVLNPSLEKIQSDLEYIRNKYDLKTKLPRMILDSGLKSRIYASLLSFYEYKLFDETTLGLTDYVSKITEQMVDPREVFDRCIQFLNERKIAIPAYSTLQKIISSGITLQENILHQRLLSILPEHDFDQLTSMAYSEESKPLITQIKKLPKTFSSKEIHREMTIFNRIKEVFPTVKHVIEELGLSKKKIHYYSSLLNYYSITKIRQLPKGKFSLFIVCFLYHRYYQISDILINGFIHHVEKLEDEAKVYSKEKHHSDLLNINDKIKKVSEILGLYVDKKIKGDTSFDTIRKLAFEILPAEQIPAIVNYLGDIEADLRKYRWEYFDAEHSRVKGILRKLFLCYDVGLRDSDYALLHGQAIKTRQDFLDFGKMSSFDKRLIKKNLRGYFYDEDSSEDSPNLRRAEMLLYIRLKERLKDGAFYIDGSNSYRKFEHDLVKPEAVSSLVEISDVIALKTNPNELLKVKEELLNQKLNDVAVRLSGSDDDHVVFEDVDGKNKWTIKRNPSGNRIGEMTFKNMKQIHIGDIVDFTHRGVDFSSSLTHIRTRKKPTEELTSIIACIVANGTRYGVRQMADLCNISYDVMKHAEKNFLRMETLHLANDIISNEIAKLDIFKYYNIKDDLIHASYDGQRFQSRFNTINTHFSKKYFGRGKGLSAVTLSANHIPINAKVMGLNDHESHHLFDVLFNNTSDVEPDIISTDSHGSNQVNFALLDLSGWAYAPRYANPGKILNDLFSCRQINDRVEIKLKKAINFNVIEEGWDFIKQILISLHSKEVTQATIIKKLSGYKPTNKIIRPLVEYDRLVKAIYMLDFVNNDELRQNIQRSLNRVESYHQMQRRIESVNGSKFRGSSDDEIHLWYECGRLICNCIIYFNCYILSYLVRGYEANGDNKKLENLRHCSPVAWSHINFNGSYSFSFDGNQLDVDDLLRQIADPV